jgi:hypothetical protein
MGAPSNRSADRAQRLEEQRMAQQRATQSRINQVFDNPARMQEIAAFVGDVRALGMQDLDRHKGIADRQLKFAVARNGQVGGSTQVDKQRTLGEDYQRGALEVDRRALGAGADLQANDEDARARLISLATQGLDATTGAARAAAAMRVNAESARSASNWEGLNSFFSSASDFVRQSREANDRREGLYASGFSPYGAMGGGGGP